MKSDNEFSKAIKVCFDLIFGSEPGMRGMFVFACVIDLIAVSLSVAAPAVLKYLIDALSSQNSSSLVVWLGVGYGVAWVVSELLLRARAYLTISVIEQVKKEATIRLCIKSIFTTNASGAEISSGAFSAKIGQVSFALPLFIDGVVWQVIPLFVRLILSVGALVVFAPIVYPVILSVSVMAFVIISVVTYSRIGDRQRLANKSMQNASWKILDSLKNKQVTIAHAVEGSELRHLERAIDESKKNALSSVAYSQIVSASQIVLLGCGLIVITIKAVADVHAGSLTVGDFVQINAYVLQFVLPVSYFGMVLSGIKRAAVTLGENMNELGESDLDSFLVELRADGAAKQIILTDVSVVSVEGNTILKNVSLNIQPGECVAVVGSSGAGKSTLAKAIIALCEISSGEIKVGTDIVSPSSIRKVRGSVGYVPQESHLFDRSLQENVLSGDREFAPIEEVLKFSGLDIDSLPPGVDLSCNHLSGGEKQRISFARAIARQPGVLILDEASSSLDARTKSIISDSVFTNFKSMTRLLITHDLDQASRADRIVVLEKGRIIDVGSHGELVKKGGWYSSYWKE